MYFLPKSFSLCSPFHLSPLQSHYSVVWILLYPFNIILWGYSVFKYFSKTLFWYWIRIFHTVLALKLFKHFRIFWTYLGGFQVCTVINSSMISILFINKSTHISPMFFSLYALSLERLSFSGPSTDFCPFSQPSSVDAAVPNLFTVGSSPFQNTALSINKFML